MADNLTAVCEPIVYKMREPQRLTILWASTASYVLVDSFIFTFTFTFHINRLNINNGYEKNALIKMDILSQNRRDNYISHNVKSASCNQQFVEFKSRKAAQNY
jgi:hypothetical protein